MTTPSLIRTRPLASAALEAALLEFRTLEDTISTLTEQLSEAKARAKFLGESEVVELVTDDMLTEGCRLSDGTEYTFEREIHCSVPKEKKGEAFNFLEEHNAGGLLRRYLTLSFGKDAAVQVATFRRMLARVLPQYEVGLKVGKAPETLVEAVRAILAESGLAEGVKVEETLELPGSTLSAFVKKEIKAGRNLPECFGVWAPMRATVVPSRTAP